VVVGSSVGWFVSSHIQSRTVTPQLARSAVTLPPDPTPRPSQPVGTTLYTYRGHSGTVLSVAWSPDSKRIASGGQDGTVQVYDAANGGNVYIYHGSSEGVDAIGWSPNGKRIASTSDDGTVQVWSAS